MTRWDRSGNRRGRAPRRSPWARTRTGRALVLALGAGAIAIVVALAVGSADRGPEDDGSTDATAFDLPALGTDGRVRLADHAGRPTVVNFFASWCVQCDAELPDFTERAEALEGRVDFVFVNSNETGNWRPMAERHDLLEYPVARDIGGSRGNGLYRALGGPGGMPMTAFYDADGELVDRVFGALLGGALDDVLERAYGIEVDDLAAARG